MAEVLRWHPHLDAWLLVLALGGGYALALRSLGPRRVPPGEPPASRGQKVSFGLGLMAVWVAADWPVHDLAERSLYTVHMVQHILLSFVAPPLLMLGTPAWLARLLLPRPLLRVVRRLTRPIVALLLFNAVVALTHWAAVVGLAVHSEAAHFFTHAALFGTALLMWTPVLSPLLELPRLPYPGQMLYLFAQSLLPTIPASFLTFADRPIYTAYEPFARPWGLSALTDQRVAGLVMKVVGGLLLWVIIAVLWFKWAAREEREGTDALAWRDVDRELERADLGR